MHIWTMQKGEFSEGGTLLGLYFAKQDAYADFVREAGEMDALFGISEAWQDDDESVTVHAGCDWLTLAPHEIKGDLAVFTRMLQASLEATSTRPALR